MAEDEFHSTLYGDTFIVADAEIDVETAVAVTLTTVKLVTVTAVKVVVGAFEAGMTLPIAVELRLQLNLASVNWFPK